MKDVDMWLDTATGAALDRLARLLARTGRRYLETDAELRARVQRQNGWAYKQLNTIPFVNGAVSMSAFETVEVTIDGNVLHVPRSVADTLWNMITTANATPPDPPAEEPADDEPYNDAQDHDPCPECHGTEFPGRDVVDPSRVCPRCDGASWV